MSPDLLTVLFDTAQHLQSVPLADSSGDSENILYLLLAGPLAGVLFYGAKMRRYRNHDKRYEYEHKSASEVANLQSYDQKVNKIVGTRKRRIDGDNSRDPRERLGSNTQVHRSF
ncbi:hypothetical protein [Gulosibacter sp. 10]|uniref:hypothetical protein n=1 Tax=Gulosibacter sp. 10 TaxID=1255570 RepID=UPI00097E8E6D|nr:hypothetical protein [Gulosibacter sp. 10]SJM69911.1 hypothetical protein FM112_14525 [Gulosibacter sp. 10]